MSGVSDRTCALCYERIDGGCPMTLEHVRAQRDHYWEACQRLERLLERGALESKPEARRQELRAQLWRNQLPAFPVWAMLIEVIEELGPDSRIGKAILGAWSK